MNAIHSQQALDPDTMVQEYRVDRVLGMGSLGIVYAAENTYFNEMVALKEFLPTNLACRKGTTVAPISSDVQPSYDWALKKFLDEARTLRELCHPQAHRNIVRVRQFIEQNDTAYMVMDYEKGRPLSDILEERGTLPEAELDQIIRPLLDGLERIHGASIWHRDIKPSNILIRPDHSPVLIDFGAARHEVVGRDPSVMSQYTPGYAAIEQFHDAAQQGPWTDIFALGGTLYRAVSGRKPAKAIERFVDNKVYAPATRAARGNYSPTLLAAIDAALALKPEERPQSIADWRRWFDGEVVLNLNSADDATAASAGAPLDATMVLGAPGASAATPPPKGHKASRPPRGKKVKPKKSIAFSALAVVFAAMVVAAVGTFLYQRQGTPPISPPGQKPNQPTQVNQPTQAGQADVQTTVPDLETLRARVAALLADMRCASLRSRLSDDRTLSLDGFVSAPEDLTRIQSALEKMAGLARVDTKVKIHPWPFCDILRVIAPLRPAAATAADLPRIALNNADLRYRTGEKLVVTAAAGSGFDGHLYVDYIDSDGSVVHLLPSPRQPLNRVVPGQEMVLGALDASDPSGDFVYEIQPPLGPGMVIAFASRHRLLEAPRPHVETTGDYVPALEAALAARASGEPDAEIVSTLAEIEIYE